MLWYEMFKAIFLGSDTCMIIILMDETCIAAGIFFAHFGREGADCENH